MVRKRVKSTPKDVQSSTPLQSELHSILGSLGVASSKDYDTVKNVVEAELTRVQIPAQFDSLRSGTLTLLASPRNAALLQYDIDTLKDRLNEALPGVVTTIKVRPQRD
jgi:hypothetical protein